MTIQRSLGKEKYMCGGYSFDNFNRASKFAKRSEIDTIKSYVRVGPRKICILDTFINGIKVENASNEGIAELDSQGIIEEGDSK